MKKGGSARTTGPGIGKSASIYGYIARREPNSTTISFCLNI
jgi:hypothetical protein